MNYSQNKIIASKRPFRFSLFDFLLCFISVSILFLEFSFNLKQEKFWFNITIALDICLIISYYLKVFLFIWNSNSKLHDLLITKKADFILILLVFGFLYFPRLAAGIIIIRLAMAFSIRILESNLGTKVVAALNLRPSQSLCLSFLGIIFIGTILLLFPAATIDGEGASLLNALFTMTSATCVSGLAVYDIGQTFTLFGQGVILFGIQAGGLGIMVLSAAFAVLVGGSIPSRRQVGLREVLDISTPEGLKTLIRSVTASTITLEIVGAVFLFFLWSEEIPSLTKRLWWSFFYAVSAFCNAGIALANNSLGNFTTHPGVLLVFMALITSGGIGFFVISDIANLKSWRIKKPRAIWYRLRTQTKVVLLATVILNSVGMLLFLFFEYDGVLHGLSIRDKIISSLFQAVSLRTTGFSTVDMSGIMAPTIIFCLVYMFIGAAPGSTGGGIKVTTAAISLMALKAMLRGKREVELLGRRVAPSIVSRSLSIVLVAGIVIALFLILLTATQQIEFEELLFETVSAFGTVGFSMGATEALDTSGKLLVTFLMFVGRVGPLTLALAIGERRVSGGIRLPEGRIAVG